MLWLCVKPKKYDEKTKGAGNLNMWSKLWLNFSSERREAKEKTVASAQSCDHLGGSESEKLRPTMVPQSSWSCKGLDEILGDLPKEEQVKY